VPRISRRMRRLLKWPRRLRCSIRRELARLRGTYSACMSFLPEYQRMTTVPRRTGNVTMLIARRPSVASLVSGLVAVSVAGCGASSAGIINLSGPASESHAIAHANAINLRPSDVHGLVGSTVALRRETKYGQFGNIPEVGGPYAESEAQSW
jgi:hypothetical protein